MVTDCCAIVVRGCCGPVIERDFALPGEYLWRIWNVTGLCWFLWNL